MQQKQWRDFDWRGLLMQLALGFAGGFWPIFQLDKGIPASLWAGVIGAGTSLIAFAQKPQKGDKTP